MEVGSSLQLEEPRKAFWSHRGFQWEEMKRWGLEHPWQREEYSASGPHPSPGLKQPAHYHFTSQVSCVTMNFSPRMLKLAGLPSFPCTHCSLFSSSSPICTTSGHHWHWIYLNGTPWSTATKFCLWAFAHAVPFESFLSCSPFLITTTLCVSLAPTQPLGLTSWSPPPGSLPWCLKPEFGFGTPLGAPAALCTFPVATLPTLQCILVCGHPLAWLACPLPYSPVPSTVSGT